MGADSRRLVVTWAVLVAVTAATTWGLSKDAVSLLVALAATFLLVAVKVALVMWEFMELRLAGSPARYLFLAWALVVPGTIAVVVR